MNQVNIAKKRANKSKKKNYYTADRNKNDPDGRVTLPFQFLEPNSVKKPIRINNDGIKWDQQKPSNQVVNYKSVSDYYAKAMKEKPKNSVQNDDCSIFKEIDRLFRNKFEVKTIPSEPEKSQFCASLRKQLKGIRVENFRKSSVRRIRHLMESDELDELSEDEADNPRQASYQEIVTQRNPFENVPSIPSFKFVFTTPVNQRLHFFNQVDPSELHFNNPSFSSLSIRTNNISQNLSLLDVSSFLSEQFRNRMTPISGSKICFTPTETCNFLSFPAPQNFQKRAASPVTREYKRNKIYFTPPETCFDYSFTNKSPIFQFCREKNSDFNEENNFFMEPPQNLFKKQFICPILPKNYFDLD